MVRRRRLAAAAALAPALHACSAAPPSRPAVTVSDSGGVPVYAVRGVPAWNDPGLLWDPELERAIDTGEPSPSADPLLYNPQALLRLGDGTLVVLDGGDLRLALVHPERDSVTARFGRTGQGPGEVYSSNGLLWPDEGDGFWLFDPGTRRATRFSRSGEVRDERPAGSFGGSGGLAVLHPRTHQPWFWRVFRDPDTGRLVDSVLRMDSVGDIRPVVGLPPRVESRARPMSAFPFFAPQGGFAPLGTGGVVEARNDIPRLTHHDPSGAVAGVVTIDWTARAIPLSAKPGVLEALAEEWPQAARSDLDDIADAFPLWGLLWPVGDSVFAMEQTRWSGPAGEPPIPPGRRIWRLFSVTGGYRGTIAFPEGFGYPYQVEDGRVTGVRRDSLGVAIIESYRIAPPPGVGG